MLHKMKLQPNPFASIKSGAKDIEMRLNDEKRQAVKVGDMIEFTQSVSGETLSAVVLNRHEHPTFAELYTAFDKTRLGYLPEEDANPNDMSRYYSEEDILKYGVVGLQIQLL